MALLGVDTGGTFTDFLYLDDDGALRLHKVLSTPAAPEQAILQGIADLGIDTDALAIVHGSTVATNAVLEAKGVSTAYISNRGLTDVLTIGRQARPELYRLTPAPRPPIVPREYCIEVDSRLSASGEPLETLSQHALDRLVTRVRELGPRAVAINLLFSFLDDSEERRIESALRQAFGDELFISRSSDVLPLYKEYERGITTTLNAMVGPLMQQYLARLHQACAGATIEIMQSSAGSASIEHAGRYPVQLLLSGPAGGLIGARKVCADDRLLTFDMGGTSTDVSIIDGDIGFTHDAAIAGYPVAVPMVDMHTIGAGGGSIATVDAGGLLQVGPRSAGADPGPACYGKAGESATVTDANVVLGRLLPGNFLGGGMRLDAGAAAKAVGNIADALGIGLVEAAQGIIDVVDDHMVRALRVMSVQRGEDPKDYTLVSFGGAGGLHVCALADALEMRRALVPVHAGVLSALGMLAAQQVREHSRTVDRLLHDCSERELEAVFSELGESCREQLVAAGQSPGDIVEHRTLDLRYAGQSHTLDIEWSSLAGIAEAFHRRHQASYGHRLDMDIELVNLRVRAVAASDAGFELPAWRARSPRQHMTTRMPGHDDVAVLQRDCLAAGERLRGPALITETSSTTWLAPGWSAEVDDHGNLLLQRIDPAD